MNTETRIALVTGAAGSGIGRSVALTLAREGATVVVNYRTSAGCAEAIVRHVEHRGGHALAVAADVTQLQDCRRLVEVVLHAYHRIDICVIGPGGGWHPSPVESLGSDEALEGARCELAPLYHLMPLVLPRMYHQQWGRLIGIGLNFHKPSPAYAYNAAKAARCSALLLAQDQAWPHGVTVNAICPGPVGALASLEAAIELCDHGESWHARRNVTPQDIAEGVALLCSDAGRFITGGQLPYVSR